MNLHCARQERGDRGVERIPRGAIARQRNEWDAVAYCICGLVAVGRDERGIECHIGDFQGHAAPPCEDQRLFSCSGSIAGCEPHLEHT